MSSGDSFLFRAGSLCPTSLSQSWDPIWLEAVQAMCVLSQLQWVHMCVRSYVCQLICVSVLLCLACFLGVIRPLWLLNCSASSSTWIPEPWGETFDEVIPVRTECSRIFHSALWVSVLVPSYCKRKLPWWWQSKGTDLGPISQLSVSDFYF